MGAALGASHDSGVHGRPWLSRLVGTVAVSTQAVPLAVLLLTQELSRGVCEYEPARDFLERYAGFLFLYRGRAIMLVVRILLHSFYRSARRGGS